MPNASVAMKVAVVGGGPAGIATLKFLATAHTFFPIPPLQVRLFESDDDIGGTFVHRVYEDAELVSSKYLTAFSDFRIPSDAPDFITPQAYVQYLRNYIAHFNLQPHIHTNSRVTRITRQKPSPSSYSSAVLSSAGQHQLQQHIIEITSPDGTIDTWHCDAVAICTGINVHPRIPAIPGMERIPVALHSSDLKTRAQFGSGTHVLILGAGETGMDIAHLAVTAPTASVTLCHREGFFCAPKIIPTPAPRGQAAKVGTRPNKPVDTSVASLFDTAYAHPVLQRSPLLWFAYDLWVRKMHWFISGTEEGPDQWVGHMSKERKHLDSLFMCKSDRALPYISAAHRSTSIWNRLRAGILNVPIRDNHGKTITVRKWPEHVDHEGRVHFPCEKTANEDKSKGHYSTKTTLKPDVVVFATGYSTCFPMLDGASPAYPQLSDANVRGIYSSSDVTVAFIGFVRPSIGAIPPLAELQAQLWTLRLLQDRYPQHMPPPFSSSAPKDWSKNAVEPYELDYKLHPRAGYDLYRDKRGVDHESYAYQLALDMGAAPTFAYMLRSGWWRGFYTWAMGSNFNTKFRLVGPWRDEVRAQGIMRGELYDVVKRSGGAVYIVTYSVIPLIVFGTMSLSLYAFFWLVSLPRKAVGGVGRLRGRTTVE